MKKPKAPMEIKIKTEDVIKAIELYVNRGNVKDDITCLEIRKTRSKEWFLIAEIE